ncbi:MAG: PAS domain S-box protein, partial [Chloroflexota bacterium]
QLRASEERHRQLFENAHDAIWLNDLEGRILTANRECVTLTGYSLDELRNLRAIELLSEESLETAISIEQRLLQGNALGSLSEVKLLKKDGSEALIQLASSLVYGNGQPVAFQHIARDVTEEKRMAENLHFLLRQITRAQEEERKRIARELHDDTIQALVVHGQRLYDLAHGTEGLPNQAIPRLEELRQQANTMMHGLRRLIQDLRPAGLDRLGLLPALRRLASDATEDSGIATEIKVLGVERRLPGEVELVLFRIAQEALRNVWKHSQATSTQITVELAEAKTRLTVSDNGKGFDARQTLGDLPRYGKLGLAGMEERARLLGGTLSIESEPGKGTTLSVELPV